MDPNEAPEKVQKLSSICVGVGAADKVGERLNDGYERNLKEMVDEYTNCCRKGKCFVHIRKVQSSNKDLRALSSLTQGSKFYKVNLEGFEVESIITNSSVIARMVKEAGCDSVRSVEKVLEDRVKRWNLGRRQKGFRAAHDRGR